MTQFGVRPWTGNPKFFPQGRPVVVMRRNIDPTVATRSAIQAAIGEPQSVPLPAHVPPLRLPRSYIHPFQRIAMEVAAKHGLSSWRELLIRRRRKLTLAKWECWWRCRNETDHSYPVIARFFGLDHTTVLCGVREYERRL